MSHELYKEFLCSQVLCFLVHRTELIITRKFFYQIVLCLNMLKISYSIQSLNQHWLLCLVELNYFLATHRLFTILTLVPQPHSAGSHLKI